MPTLDDQPADKPPLPTPVILIALLFIIPSALGTLSILLSLYTTQGLNLDCGSPLALFAGIGLLCRFPPAYDVALFLLGLDILIAPIAFVIALITHAHFTLLASGLFLLTSAIALWLFQILRRPHIKSIYRTPPKNP